MGTHRLTASLRRTASWRFVAGLAIILMVSTAHSQEACPRIMKRDTTRNNLIDPPGYKTAPLGTLGGVVTTGIGNQAMIIIPGLGFGGSVFDAFAAAYADKYRVYQITLAGMAGTPAPPCPPESVSFSAQTWTNGAQSAIEKLMVDERISNAVVVGHWLTGTQLAIRLAMKHPDVIKGVVLLTAAPTFNVTDTTYTKFYDTFEKRVSTVDKMMGRWWFKYVTRETWDDNNFFPTDYAVHPVLGLRMWRIAAEPELHVWVRYLCEFESQDITRDIRGLKTPTLILNPGYEGLWIQGNNNYMQEAFGHKGWGNSLDGMTNVTSKTIANARCCLWIDQPKAVAEAMNEFLSGLK